MARTRNIKPGFFTNPELLQCQPLSRILFAGLWCYADREGRLQDRPSKFKIEILPADPCDIEALLAELLNVGLIVRYQSDAGPLVAVPSFGKHQNPHVKEPPSTLPAPDLNRASTRQARKPRQGRARQEPVEPGLPPSPNLSPPSSVPTERAGEPPLSDPPFALKPEEASKPAEHLEKTPTDVQAEFWRVGKAYLGRNGVKNPGAMVGKWCREYGDGARDSGVSWPVT